MIKKTNRLEMYKALANHYIAFPTGFIDDAARIDDILAKKAAVDAKIDLLDAERVTQSNNDKALADANNLRALKPVWEQELIDERAGHNRPEVIAELEANITSVPV